MKITEQMAAVIAGLGIVMKILLISGGDTVLAISLLILAIIYNPLGFFYFNSIPIRKVFDAQAYKGLTAWRAIGAFVAGVLFSILTSAILFKLLQLPGAYEMMTVGLVSGGLLLLVTGIKYLVSTYRSYFLRMVLARTVVWVALAGITFFTPGTAMVELFFRNNPAYVEAYKKAAADPGNEALQLEAEELRDGM